MAAGRRNMQHCTTCLGSLPNLYSTVSLFLTYIHTHTHTHTHIVLQDDLIYWTSLPREHASENVRRIKKYQCYPDADQAIIAPLASNPSSSSPSWKHAGGIQIPPAGPPWLCVSGVSSAEVRDMILNDTAAGLSISFDLFLHPLPPQQHTHIIFHHYCHYDNTKSNVHAFCFAPVGWRCQGTSVRRCLCHMVLKSDWPACRPVPAGYNGICRSAFFFVWLGWCEIRLEHWGRLGEFWC